MSPEQTETERLRAALDEALAERARLWDELQRRTADEHEAEFLRDYVRRLEGSISWRVTAPLRFGKVVAEKSRHRLEPLRRDALKALGRGR